MGESFSSESKSDFKIPVTEFYPLQFAKCFKQCVYGLFTKREVKMAGYWPSYFFCVRMDEDGLRWSQSL